MPIAKYAQQNLAPTKKKKKRSRGIGGGLWKPKLGQSFSENISDNSANPRIEPQAQVQS